MDSFHGGDDLSASNEKPITEFRTWAGQFYA